jgi:hypothetical protein
MPEVGRLYELKARDEKKTNPIRTIERSESLSHGLFVAPLLSEAVFLLPSVFSPQLTNHPQQVQP